MHQVSSGFGGLVYILVQPGAQLGMLSLKVSGAVSAQTYVKGTEAQALKFFYSLQ